MKFQHLQLAQNHMATTFRFTVSVPEHKLAHAEILLRDCHALVSRLESELSEFIPSSPVARLNSAAPGARVAVPPSVIELLELGDNIRERTDGAFDCTAKSRDFSAGQRRVEWDELRGEAWTNAAGTHVGFGAIGKGYALDEVRRRLEREGFTDYLLNAGGSSILISGFAAPNLPWQWAWSWRRDEDGDCVGFELTHASGVAVALGVSGLMEQGKHLLDPRTRQPVAGMRSALVAHDSAACADALSTALFVLGWDEGMKRVPDEISQPAVAVIDADEVPAWNGVFQRLWGAPGATLSAFLAVFFLSCLSALPAFAQDGEQAVDLSELGLSTFQPYNTERNPWWILLPVAVLWVVMLHLPFPWNKKKAKR